MENFISIRRLYEIKVYTYVYYFFEMTVRRSALGHYPFPISERGGRWVQNCCLTVIEHTFLTKAEVRNNGRDDIKVKGCAYAEAEYIRSGHPDHIPVHSRALQAQLYPVSVFRS